MRLTIHNGRAGKNGVYSPRHNDRNFDVDDAPHINPDKIRQDRFWHRYQKTDYGMTFEQAEARFYEEHFREALDARNEKSVRQHHPERVQTMDQYRKSAKSCPEETIFQLGKVGETVDPDLLWDVVVKYIGWEVDTFPNVHILDVALHADEEGAPHLQIRKVWVAHDEEGREIVGQAKALTEMGIERPNPDKPQHRHNNAKQTYSRQCRDKAIEIAQSYGLDIELVPLEASKTGLTLEEYKARQEREKAEQARQEAEQARQEREREEAAAQQAREEAQIARRDAAAAIERERSAKATLEAQRAKIRAQEGRLGELHGQIEIAGQELRKTLSMKARAAEIKKPMFGQDSTVSYHENMLEATRAIGDEAYRHMQRAMRDRETAAQLMERITQIQEETTTLQQEAKAARDQAEVYRMDLIGHIHREAKELVKEQMDRLTPKEERMAAAMDRTVYRDGSTLWQRFQKEEEERQKEMEREIEKTVAKRGYQHGIER